MLVKVSGGSPRMPNDPTRVQVPPQAPREEPQTDTPKFSDVSHRESVDWDTYAKSGRKVAICKTTEGGDWVDPAFAGSRSDMQRLGLYCGLYHFAGASAANEINDPIKEADFYVDTVGKLGPKEFPVLDFELPYHMTPAQQVTWMGKWCTEVEKKTGKTPWIYSYSGMMEKWDASSLTKYPLWLANYQSSDPKEPPDSGSWPNITAWQYTWKATVPGVDTKCDESYLYGDLPSLTKPKDQP